MDFGVCADATSVSTDGMNGIVPFVMLQTSDAATDI